MKEVVVVVVVVMEKKKKIVCGVDDKSILPKVFILFSLPLFLSFFVSICVCVSLSMPFSVFLSHSVSLFHYFSVIMKEVAQLMCSRDGNKPWIFPVLEFAFIPITKIQIASGLFPSLSISPITGTDSRSLTFLYFR